MKKLVALLLCAVMILSLGACSVWEVIPTKGTEPEEEWTAEATRRSREATTEAETTEPETETAAPTEPETEPAEPVTAAYYDSSFYSMSGTAARLGEYTYFVSGGLNNDASGNGIEDSADIYRIKDGEEAAELVCSLPASVEAGTTQDTLFYLAAGSGKLWFLAVNRRQTDAELQLLSLDPETLDAEVFDVPFSLYSLYSDTFDIDPIFFDKDAYYFVTADRKLWRFDTLSECFDQPGLSDAGSTNMAFDLSEIDWSQFGGTAGIVCPATVSHGYLYYCLTDLAEEQWINNLLRVDLETLETEMIAEIDVEEELEDSEYFYASANYFYYLLDDELHAVRVNDGAKLTVLDAACGLANEYFPTWCITDEDIWFVNEEGVFRCDPEGNGVVKIADDKAEEEKMGLAVSGDYLFYSLNDHPKYTGMAKADAVCPVTPLVEIDYDQFVFPGAEGDWDFTIYPIFSKVTGYGEHQETLQVPEVLGGRPVRSVGSWNKDSFSGVKTLILPDSLVSVGYLYAEGLERLVLPKTLETFTHRGFTYSLRTDTTLTVEYSSTLEQFKAICEHSSDLYADMGIDADCGSTKFILECADGLFTCEPSPDGEEEFVPYNPAAFSVSAWIGTFEWNGEKFVITDADENGITLDYHGFTAAGGTFVSHYVMAYENDEKTMAGEDKSVEAAAGYRYVLILDGDTITLKSRYPDRVFTRVK